MQITLTILLTGEWYILPALSTAQFFTYKIYTHFITEVTMPTLATIPCWLQPEMASFPLSPSKGKGGWAQNLSAPGSMQGLEVVWGPFPLPWTVDKHKNTCQYWNPDTTFRMLFNNSLKLYSFSLQEWTDLILTILELCLCFCQYKDLRVSNKNM